MRGAMWDKARTNKFRDCSATLVIHNFKSTCKDGTHKSVAIPTSHIQPFLFVKFLDMCTALSVKALNIHLLKHEQIEVSTDVVFP